MLNPVKLGAAVGTRSASPASQSFRGGGTDRGGGRMIWARRMIWHQYFFDELSLAEREYKWDLIGCWSIWENGVAALQPKATNPTLSYRLNHVNEFSKPITVTPPSLI